jgi:hypothetical protein
MSSHTAAGATIGLTATAPTTFNKTGWNAITPTTIGEVTDLGDFGREYTDVTHKPLSSRGTIHKKGSYDEGSINLTFALDPKDAGQILLKTASQSDSDYYFLVTDQTGDKYYFPAQVRSFKRHVGGVDNVVTGTAILQITGTGVFEDLVP